MTFDGYEAFDDPYVYRDTSVLKNKADIRDQMTLDAFELEMTSLAAMEPIPSGRFDSRHLKAIHRHLFGAVYSWAGKTRTVRISKEGNSFCFPEYIDSELEKLLAALEGGKAWRGLEQAAFVGRTAHLLAELNAIHPFREGNGRAQLTFLSTLSAECGHPFNFALIDRRTYLPAIISSFGGDQSALQNELSKLLINRDNGHAD